MSSFVVVDSLHYNPTTVSGPSWGSESCKNHYVTLSGRKLMAVESWRLGDVNFFPIFSIKINFLTNFNLIDHNLPYKLRCWWGRNFIAFLRFYSNWGFAEYQPHLLLDFIIEISTSSEFDPDSRDNRDSLIWNGPLFYCTIGVKFDTLYLEMYCSNSGIQYLKLKLLLCSFSSTHFSICYSPYVGISSTWSQMVAPLKPFNVDNSTCKPKLYITQ